MCLSIAFRFPDRVLAQGNASGSEWIITHNNHGYRCGYLQIPHDHPWYEKDHNNIDADVHGGLTFSEPDVLCDAEGDDNAWWVGFDCTHCWDAPDPTLPVSPEIAEVNNLMSQISGRIIRSQHYVHSQITHLINQAIAAA